MPSMISRMRCFWSLPSSSSAAHAVHRLALLVHDVVVFEDVFAGGEILRLDRLLRGGDALGDHLALDGHILFHAQAQHQILHLGSAEDAHQIVLQGEIEARAAGIALASRASAKLVVDAAGVVPLRAQNVQAAERHHFVVLLVGLRFDGLQHRIPILPWAPRRGPYSPCAAAPWRGTPRCRRAKYRFRGRPCWWRP